MTDTLNSQRTLDLSELLSALRNPSWCYDSSGQDFSYVDTDLAFPGAAMMKSK